MASSNKMQIKVTADVTEAARQLGSLTSRVTAFSKSIKKNFDVALGKDAMKLSSSLASKLKWVALGMGTLGAASLKMAADFEMVKRSMTVLTGSAKEAQAHLNDLERFAATTPFEFSGLVDASKRLQAYGFEAQAVIPILQTVGDAAMAVGLSQEGVDRLTLAFGQIAAKGKLSAEEMRQISETGVPAWKMLAESMGTSVADVMDKTKKGAISAQAALEGIFGGMQKRFGGMMDAVAKEIPQQLSNMKDAIVSIMRGVGEKITQAFDLKERLYSVTSWLTAFAQIIKTSGVSEAFDQLVPDSVREALVVIAATVAGLVVPAFVAWAAATIAATWPLLAIGAACGVAAAVIYENWDSMGGFFTDLWDAVVEAFTAAWETIKGVCEKIVDIVGFVIKKLEKLTEAIAQTAQLRTSALGDAGTEKPAPAAKKTLSAQEKADQQAAMEDYKNGKGRPKSITEAIVRAKNQLAKTALDLSGNTDWKSLFAGSLGDDSGFSGGKAKKGAKGKTAAEKLVQGISDQIKYLNADGESFLPVLDKWLAKSKPLSEDWKKIRDLQLQITEDAEQRNPFSAANVLERNKQQIERMKSLEEQSKQLREEEYSNYGWQNAQGLMGDTEYLDKLKERFANLSEQFKATGGSIENFLQWPPELQKAFSDIQSAGSSGFAKALDLLKSRFENGKISGTQYKAAIEQLKVKFADMPLVIKLADDALKAYENTMNKFPTAAQQATSAWDSARGGLNAVPAGIGNAFESAIRGTESLGEAMLDLLQDLGAVIAKALIMRALFGGGEGGGFFGSGGGFLGMLGLKFHGGGTVGAGGTPTLVSPSVFANAPRMHGGGIAGLRSDEVPAILQRGEVVQPKNARAGGAAAGGDNYQITIQAIDASSFVKMLQNNKGTIESLIVNGLQRGGPLRMAVKGAV